MEDEKKDLQITPAALGALLKGDYENAARAMVPGGIRAQEKQGILDLSSDNRLPITMKVRGMECARCNIDGMAFRGEGEDQTLETCEKCHGTTLSPEAMQWLYNEGFRFGERVDDIFMEARLPEGWKKVMDEGRWLYLKDEYGRRRASITYKAAFYDRHARMSFKTYLSTRCLVYEGSMSDKYRFNRMQNCRLQIIDADDNILYDTGCIEVPYEKDPNIRIYAHDIARRKAVLYKDKYFPEHKKAPAYWGEPAERPGPSVGDVYCGGCGDRILYNNIDVTREGLAVCNDCSYSIDKIRDEEGLDPSTGTRFEETFEESVYVRPE